MNGATKRASQSTEGRSDPPVKPTSEVAHQPGQQQTWPTVAEDMKTWVTHPQLVTATVGRLALRRSAARRDKERQRDNRWRPRRDAPGKPLRRGRFDQVTKRRVAPGGPSGNPRPRGSPVTQHRP